MADGDQTEYVLRHEQAERIFTYLCAQPYREVHALIAEIQSLPVLYQQQPETEEQPEDQPEATRETQ